MYEDKKLICRDCAKEFTWTAGEQQFFASKGFDRPPVRCPECRKKKKAKFQGKAPQVQPVSEEMHQIKCKKCGKVSEVPFKPQFPDDILCANCFEESLNTGPKKN